MSRTLQKTGQAKQENSVFMRKLMRALCVAAMAAWLAGVPGQPVLADDSPADGPTAAQADGPADVPGSHLADQPGLADLRGYLERADESNNELRAAHQKWQAAIKRALRADTLPDPMVNFGYYTTPLETRGGPARYKYGLSQSFPFFGKLGFKEQAALREADGFKAQLDALRLATFAQVKKTYYEYAYLAQAMDITRETMRLVEYMERIATSRYTTGGATHADIIRPQVELGKLEDRLRSLDDLRRPLAARINALLDLPPATAVPLPEAIPVMAIDEPDDALHDALRTSNPKLAYWDTVAAKEEAAKSLAQRNYYPDVTLGVDVTEVDASRSPGVTGDGRNPVMTSMSFNIPIWIEARGAAVDESQANILAARRSRAGLEQQLRADLELALYKYRDAGRKIGLYRDTLVPKAEQSMGATLEAFMTGGATALALIDAEKTLLEFQLAYYRALTDQAQQLAEIETLVGRELPCRFHGSLLKRTIDTNTETREP
jgi:outer membrane protein TolC